MNFKKLISKNRLLFIIIILIIGILLTIFNRYLYNFVNNYGINIEGFDSSIINTDSFTLNRNIEEIYDGFYSKIYDHLTYDQGKHNFEIDNIKDKTPITKNSNILDIGSGTGHLLGGLENTGSNLTGIDKSKYMCIKAKENYPKINFINDDVLRSILFDNETFSHITCMYFTLYYIKDKRLFFKNCYDWLVPGGHMIIHLVNKNMFDPVLSPGNPLHSVNAQKYAPERIIETNIVFNNYRYKSEFLIDNETRNNTEFIEKFSNKESKKVFRKNIHTLYMEEQKPILNMAKEIGFVLKAKADMTVATYEYNYIYFLQKPN